VPNRLGLAAVFLLIAAAAGCTHQAPRAAAPAPRASGHASASTLPAGPATFPGPDGVEARWVIQENRKAGTTAWKIHGRAAGVSGFAGQVYAGAFPETGLRPRPHHHPPGAPGHLERHETPDPLRSDAVKARFQRVQ
jgi:hypothetical protein